MKHFVISGEEVINIIECDDDFDPGAGRTLLAADGVDGDIGWQVVDGLPVPPELAPPTGDDVNAERKRRILAGRVFSITGGLDIRLEGDEQTVTNLQGLAFGASLRIAAGDTTTVTPYRDADNVTHDLTPLQMVELWRQSAAYVSALYQASWALKAMDPIPADVTADQYWPVV